VPDVNTFNDTSYLGSYTVGAAATVPRRIPTMAELIDVLKTCWGYDTYLPLQEEAMSCVMQRRDSLLVLPTGGGKSLCYQAPAVALGGTAVVVSPLISLMKDQVDALTECGVPAACLNSTVEMDQFRRLMSDLRAGKLRMLYLAPERLVMDKTIAMLRELKPTFLAVDEAHCISQWGHDFRPEYRALGALRAQLPGTPVHAYTATATERVRADIVEQLNLKNAEVLVGSFDRPNLAYRVVHRQSALDQVMEVIDRHPGESGIVYCISRNDVERTTKSLVKRGISARPYHAGLPDEVRHANQDAFLADQAQVVVATVAFGMGIDKSNVRFVVHAGAPKSLEAYQQEAGRAGRDRLDAECTLFYSGSDFAVWRKLLESVPEEARAGAMQSLNSMYAYCTRLECRHRALVKHFGQDLPPGQCNACDVCRGEVDQVADPMIVGQKILSGVARLQQRFGADYTSKVLCGSNDKTIMERRHDVLSTYGLLKTEGYSNVRDWIEQLVGQGYLQKEGEYQVLRLTNEGLKLLRGQATPMLTRPKPVAAGKSSRKASGGSSAAAKGDSWEGVHRGLFDELRALRKEKADAAHVPAYIIMGDATLRGMARKRPSTLAGLRQIEGMGDARMKQHGQVFLAKIVEYCREHLLATDVG
jgi:ATP-dependent DNA helicase RecQ